MMEAIEAFLKERNTSCKKRFNENNKESESLEKSESLVVYLSNHFPLTCLVPLFMDYIFRCQHSRNQVFITRVYNLIYWIASVGYCHK